MKNLALLVPCLGCILTAASSPAADLKQSKLTQVVNDVQIISAAEQNQKAATVNDIFAMPDILSTGVASRAELVAQDQTVTRVGANTIFSFDPSSRTIDLKQGSLLFHAPHGKGGGNIHTGAATAAVLGTTLIVVTTANGGFKVLALEGHVQVTLPNGLKQILGPGQMTFILPGASQLAPVIIFHLDELVRNSLLVGGFADTLDSWPLIEAEIARQEKLIHSGRLSDTPFYVGDDATPSQVQVLDINSYPQNSTPKNTSDTSGNDIINPTDPAKILAESSDAIINQPSLTDPSVPTPPNHIFNSLGTPDGYSSSSKYQGFLAGNITFDLRPDSDGLSVDLSPYSDSGPFSIIARKDMNFNCSVTFSGLLPLDDLYLYAVGKMNLAQNITLSAYADNFLLWSGGAMNLDYVTIENNLNNLVLFSVQSLEATQSMFSASGDLSMGAVSDLNISGSSLSGNAINLFSSSGDVNVSGNTINCQDLNVISYSGSVNLSLAGTSSSIQNNINVSAQKDIYYTGQYRPYLPIPKSGFLTRIASTFSSDNGASASGTTTSTAIYTAGGLASVSYVDFSQFAYVNIMAKTIFLANDAFYSTRTLNLGTANGGTPQIGPSPTQNIGGPTMWNCTYDGTPITANNVSSIVHLSSGPGTQAGIYSYKTP